MIPLNMTHSGANETHFQTLETTSIVNFCIQVTLFCIGLFAQLKIIKVCKEEKNKTWQIHIFHAITMTILFSSRIVFMAIVYILPSLFTTIGSWVCHLFRFVFLYGFISITSNSFVIASMKFVFIVHSMKALAFGESRIQKLFLGVNLVFPFIISLDSLLPDFQPFGYISICFNPELWSNSTYENVQWIADGLLKNLIEIDLQEPHFAIYIKLFLNIFRILAFIIAACNFTEALIYYKIFKVMKR